jgi:serine protease inhibitor
MKIKNLTSLILLSAALMFASCNETEDPNITDNNNIKVSSTQDLANANEIFGWNLLKAETDQKKDENVIISPLSVQLALYMATNGANGITEDEMLEMLQCKNCDIKSINEQAQLWIQLLSKESGHPTLSISNGFFYDDNRLKILGPGFKNDLAAYDCSFEKSDFSNVSGSLKLINDWVKDKTNGKIDQILDDINDADIAFLINALYFKADWSKGFNTFMTQKDEFYTSKGEKKLVTFIGDSRSVMSFSDDKTKLVDIPFRDSTYSLTLIQQENAIEELNAKTFKELLGRVKYKGLIINFPKINVKYENDIVNSLKTLGMQSAFSSVDADFSSMGAATNRIYINQIKHKVVIDADEKGVEGAAVTSIGFGATEAPPSITFDKPFYIVLRHINTNTMIFVGKINDPSL